jgi:hypothetical protein
VKKFPVFIQASGSTHRWLHALAKANKTTIDDLLTQAAFCFADHAGRREGSWEADVAGSMLRSSGFQLGIPDDRKDLLQEMDENENAAHRARTARRLKGAKP